MRLRAWFQSRLWQLSVSNTESVPSAGSPENKWLRLARSTWSCARKQQAGCPALKPTRDKIQSVEMVVKFLSDREHKTGSYQLINHWNVTVLSFESLQHNQKLRWRLRYNQTHSGESVYTGHINNRNKKTTTVELVVLCTMWGSRFWGCIWKKGRQNISNKENNIYLNIYMYIL